MNDGVGVRLERSLTLSELAAAHGGRLSANLGPRVVDRIASPRNAARDTDLVVVTSAKAVSTARDALGVLLCEESLAHRLPARPLWTHPHVWWAIAQIIEADVSAPTQSKGRHRGLVEGGSMHGRAVSPSAQVDPLAEVDATALVGAGAVVMAGARIRAEVVIGPNAVIYGGVVVGRGARIGPCAVIGKPGFGFARGPDGEVVRIPQRGGVVIEEDVEIGALSTVDAGTLGPTVVGRGSKLDAHVHVGHNVELGPGAFVAAQVGFAGSARIGQGVRMGGQSGVADHVTIGDGVSVAAKSGVIGDVASGRVVAGFPAVDRRRWLRAMARLLGPKQRGAR